MKSIQQALFCIRRMLEGTGIQRLQFNNREGSLPGLTYEGVDYTVDAAYNLQADEPMLVCSGNDVVRKHIPTTNVAATDLNELVRFIGTWLMQTREIRTLCRNLQSMVGEMLPYSSLAAQLDGICSRAGATLYNGSYGWDHTSFPGDYDDEVIFSVDNSYGIENPNMCGDPFFEVHYSETDTECDDDNRFVVLNSFDFFF